MTRFVYAGNLHVSAFSTSRNYQAYVDTETYAKHSCFTQATLFVVEVSLSYVEAYNPTQNICNIHLHVH